jgi:hypothetical protein
MRFIDSPRQPAKWNRRYELALIGAGDESSNYAYVLRVIAFLLIVAAIVDRNLAGRT